MLTSEPQWVALYTNPRAEKKAESNLKETGFEVYLPLRKELHTWSDRKKWVEVPLLKSYIFAKITAKQQIPVVNEMMKVPGKDYEDAKTILNWDSSGLQVAKSSAGERMNEVKTHGNWAEKTLMLASIYGVV